MTGRTAGMGEGPRPVDWEELLLVYMHDPVDKALDIRGHEARAARYASRALGRKVDRSEIKSSAALADQLAAIAERIPMPTAGVGGERAVGPEHGRLEVRHPVSAESSAIENLAVDEDAVLDAIDDIVHGLDSPRQRYLALWRLLPERLEQRLGSAFVRQPADTRVPDHTLFHHADIASGIWASRGGAHGGAYLSLSLGPVQPFIAAARTVRDLWSGSAILSWLTFQGLTPVLERLGPTALVFPALRGSPLMDLWLRGERAGLGDRVELPSISARRSPSIPNRFLALAPWGPDGRDGHAMAGLCADAVRAAWRHLSEDVRTRLDSALRALDPEWAHRWKGQVEQFFEVRASVAPERPLDDGYLASLICGSGSFDTVWPDAAAVRGLAAAIPAGERPGYDQTSSGRWQAQLEISARLAEARTVRHVPANCETTPSPAKCSLLGSFEQMGPDGLEDGRRFWDVAREKLNVDGVRLRAGERFSAVALCKRFAAPTTLARELDLAPKDFRFPDTATVAAADWLRDASIEPDDVRRRTGDWNGRWLHQTSRATVEDDEAPPPREVWDRIAVARKAARPPTYYAILMMDADHMGRWLGGGLGPPLRDVLHPKMRDYYEGLGERARRGLDARRPVGPALHASISDALNNFASHVAPVVARAHAGTMIYSGGDDVLTLLPARRAVACADALQKAFRGLGDEGSPGLTSIDDRQFLAMGKKASMSAGIAFVHVKEDLRLVLQAAREGEKKAKDCGRNALSLRFMRRSGEHAEIVLGWDLAPWFQDMVGIFAGGATDRWVYRLRAELPTLGGEGIPEAAVGAEIRRLFKRASDSAGARTAGPNGRDAEEWWRYFAAAGRRRGRSTGELLTDFTLTCQGASFVARGGDA